MTIRVDLHVHDARGLAILLDLQASLAHLVRQGHTIMTKLEDMRAELVSANTVTSEIASDVDELVRKANSAEGLTDADVAAARDLTTRLRAVAAAYTADTPPV